MAESHHHTDIDMEPAEAPHKNLPTSGGGEASSAAHRALTQALLNPEVGQLTAVGGSHHPSPQQDPTATPTLPNKRKAAPLDHTSTTTPSPQPQHELDPEVLAVASNIQDLPGIAKFICERMQASDAMHRTQTDALSSALTASMAQLSTSLTEQMNTLLNKFNVLEQKVDKNSADIQQLQQDHNAVAGQVQTVQQDVTANATLLETTQKELDWTRGVLSSQIHDLHKALAINIQNHIAVRPERNFPGGMVAFGQLTEAELSAQLGLPATHPCTIQRRVKALTPGSPPADWQVGDPCSLIVADLKDHTITEKVLNKHNRNQLKVGRHLSVSESLSPMELKEKNHLQSNAMPHLLALTYMKGDANTPTKYVGWRRSQVTWLVHDKNNFALLSAADVPIGATEGQVLAAVKAAEGRLMTRTPRNAQPTLHTSTTTNSAATGPSVPTAGTSAATGSQAQAA
jgi:hypothetical protein